MTAAIILAAGSSSRLGQPKQNLHFQHRTLLQRTIETALISGCEPVVVVVGANSQLVKPFIQDQHIHLVDNPDWEEGMSSSIRIGITALAKFPKVDSSVILLCDQPFISSQLIGDMIRKQKETGKLIVACNYNHTLGVPALFHKSFFNVLLSLTGSDGAKKLLKNHSQEIVIVPFDKGSIDIDTPEDYDRLLNSGD